MCANKYAEASETLKEILSTGCETILQPKVCEALRTSLEALSIFEHAGIVIKIPHAKEEPEWMPVSVEPPKEERSYLVQLDTGDMVQCRWTSAGYIFDHTPMNWHWNKFDIPQYCRVEAWRPLPTKYIKNPE